MTHSGAMLLRTTVALCACLAAAAGCSRSGDASTPVVSSPVTAVPAATTVATIVATTAGEPSPPPTTTTTTTTTTTSTTTTTTSTTTSTTTTTTTTTLPPVTLPPVTTPSAARGSIYDVRPASDIPPPPIPDGWSVESIGTSVQGREIAAWARRVAQPERTVVVIGAVHGNEPASPPVVRSLVQLAYPDDVEVWLVPVLNPDGVAAGTRWNANGVDLNRNFPWGWRADDGGPAPLSEPESAAAVALVERVSPDLVVWVHQPYGYVTSVGGSHDRFEQAWSAGSGLPVRPDVTQHGGGESWTHFGTGTDAVLVEIGTWDATAEIVAAQRRGFEQLLASW